MKVFSILSSIILLFPTRTSLQACSYGSEYEELRYMLFNPDLLQHKSWWTFFYNNKLDYLDGSVFANDDERLLAAEWKKNLSLKASQEDIRKGLFESLSDSALEVNSFYQEIQNNDAAQKYFEIARQCEGLSSMSSEWDENPEQEAVDQDERSELIKSIQNILTKENSFLKQKYAFQLLKLAFYQGDGELFNSVYEQYYRSTQNKTVLDWWAMHYKSMMLEYSQQTDSANYLHALVFSHASNKMLISKRMFSRAALESVLALAQNDEERADIYVLGEVINPGRSLENIGLVHSLSPSHKHLPMLIGREVNKLEDWLGSPKFANSEIISSYEEGEGDRWQRDQAYLKEFILSVEGMEAFANIYPDFYHLSLSNLYLMADNPSAAAQHLSAVKSNEPHVLYQKKVFDVVLTTQKEDIANPTVQEKIGTALQDLLQQREQKFESQKMLYSLSSYLRYSFARKGIIHLAGLFDNLAVNKFCHSCNFATFEYSMISYFDQHASVNDMKKLLEVYDRKEKNKLEEILLRPYANKYYLCDLLGTIYMRQGDVQNALGAFKLIPNDFWFSFSNASYNLDTDPFTNNEELFGQPTMAVYNKREIAEKLIQLEQEAIQNPSKRQRNYFLLGNAWYNFTQNSWFVLSYGHSAYGDINEQERQAWKRAASFYKKSLQAATIDEDKVKLNYMLALLSDESNKRAYAVAYERYSTTEFYSRKNCLTLSDIAQGNL